jgi:hypothetical protein
MDLGSTQYLKDMSNRIVPRGKVWSAHKAVKIIVTS